MKPTRRGFFRAILALPFAPKCIQAFRPKPCVHTKAINAYACGRCGKRWDECRPGVISVRKAIHYEVRATQDFIPQPCVAEWIPIPINQRVGVPFEINPEKQ